MGDSPGDPTNLFVFESASESTPEFDISDPEVIRMLEESQRSHFWFQARNRQILQFLRRDGLPPPGRVLEVGCGTGTVLSALAGAGYQMAGVEMHPLLARRAASWNPGAEIYSLNVEAPPPQLLHRGPFDAVALFDVVEHLAEPEAFLLACAALLRPGGLLVGTVPALRMLWSDYDAVGGHRLRYDRRSLRALFTRAALPVPRASYFFQFLLPGILLRRVFIGQGRVSDKARKLAAQHLALDAPGPTLNRALAGVCAIERLVRRAVPLDRVPGTSLWFSARIPSPESFRAASRPRVHIGDKP